MTNEERRDQVKEKSVVSSKREDSDSMLSGFVSSPQYRRQSVCEYLVASSSQSGRVAMPRSRGGWAGGRCKSNYGDEAT